MLRTFHVTPLLSVTETDKRNICIISIGEHFVELDIKQWKELLSLNYEVKFKDDLNVIPTEEPF